MCAFWESSCSKLTIWLVIGLIGWKLQPVVGMIDASGGRSLQKRWFIRIEGALRRENKEVMRLRVQSMRFVM